MMDIAIFQYMSGTFENMLSFFAIDGAQNIMDAIKPLVYTAVTIYIMVQGYGQISGKSDDLAIDVITTCLVVMLVSHLVLNSGNYTEYIIGGVEALGAGLASAVVSDESENIYMVLDKVLQTGVDQALWCLQKVGALPSSWTWLSCALVVLLAIGSFTVVAAVIILGTKFLLAMLLLVGPIFIIMACFPPTRRFLDGWLNKVFENVLVQVFAVALLFLLTEIINQYMSKNNLTEGEMSNPAAIIVQIAVISAILIYVMKQIPNLAGALAGGFASALMTLPKISPKPDQRPPESPDRIPNRDTWAQQQQNQIRAASPKNANGIDPRNEISQDLKDRIAEHNMRNK